jgi:predicted polyphosphate/ATP-dependent NAD kinase
MTLSVGLIVNPIAGIGGPLAMKGSDGEDVQRRALARGVSPRSNARAAVAVRRLTALHPDLTVVTVAGLMGEEAAREAGVDDRHLRVVRTGAMPSHAEETVRAAREMVDESVDLLLFVGGDGTARDIVEAVGERLAVLGIPAGVKMQSAVFAVSPLAAAELAAAYLSGKVPRSRREVVDIDEEEVREGRISSVLYGYLQVPCERRWLQNKKVGSNVFTNGVVDIAASFVAQMEPDRHYVLGPGTTLKAVTDRLGFAKTLMGVDVVTTTGPVAMDVTASDLDQLVDDTAVIVVSPTGGQGFLFGRGNQQISATALSRVGLKGVVVLCTAEKLGSFQGQPLIVQTEDPEVDAKFSGYVRVITGYRDSTLYRIRNSRE